MDLMEHYLSAVAAQLDKGQREDIVAELRDTLLNRFEEREEALGRPLTDDEREAILREMGHPLVVAARYGKGPQHLVGPELFPWWLFAVKAGLMVLAAVHVLLLVIRLFTAPNGFPQALGQVFGDLIEVGLFWVGAATVAAYLIERNGWRPEFMTDWRVKDLPVLKLSDPDAWREAMSGDRAPPARTHWMPSERTGRWPAGEAIFGIVAIGVFIAWWGGVWSLPGIDAMIISGDGGRLIPAPIWDANFLPILLLAVGQLWIEILRLMRPQWVRAIAALQAVAAAVGLAIAWTVFHAGHWFTLVEGGSSVRIAGGWGRLDFDQLRAIDERSRDLIGAGTTLSVILTWVMFAVMLSLAFAIFGHLWRLMVGQGCTRHGRGS